MITTILFIHLLQHSIFLLYTRVILTQTLLTSVQSLSRGTVVSVGFILIVFSSIRLFKELPPRKRKHRMKNTLGYGVCFTYRHLHNR